MKRAISMIMVLVLALSMCVVGASQLNQMRYLKLPQRW